jgi:hypothetical protein
MAIVFVYATLGGMKGITWTQVAQYWVLITAFLIAGDRDRDQADRHPPCRSRDGQRRCCRSTRRARPRTLLDRKLNEIQRISASRAIHRAFVGAGTRSTCCS